MGQWQSLRAPQPSPVIP